MIRLLSSLDQLVYTRRRIHRSKYGDILLTRKGNSSVTSTLTNCFSTTSVVRFVNEKITSTMLRTPLNVDGLTSTAVRGKVRPRARGAAPTNTARCHTD